MTLLLLLGGAGTGFVLSDFEGTHVYISDPVAGVTEVTGDVYAVEVQRGRDRELDEINAGTARIRVRNHTGNFGPFVSGGGDYGEVTLGMSIIITQGESTTLNIPGTVGVCVFFGYLEDVDYDFAPVRFAEATLVCADAMGRMGRQSFLEWTTTDAQLTGARLTDIFARSDVSAAGPQDFDAGTMTLQTDDVSHGTNVLSYCQFINRNEQGRFFVGREGMWTFQDNAFVAQPGLAVVDFDSTATGQVDDEIPFSMVEVMYGSELLYTKVSVDNVGGTVQTADDATAQSAYGIRHLTFTNMLLNSDAQALAMAEYLLARYKDPEAVISAITVPLEKLSTANKDTVSALEIGDTVTLHWTPYNQDAVARTLVIEGISYSKSIFAPTEMRFQLSASPAAPIE